MSSRRDFMGSGSWRIHCLGRTWCFVCYAQRHLGSPAERKDLHGFTFSRC